MSIAGNDAFVISLSLTEMDQFLNCYLATGSLSRDNDDDKENINKVIGYFTVMNKTTCLSITFQPRRPCKISMEVQRATCFGGRI